MRCVAHLVGAPWECQTISVCEKESSNGPSELTLSDSVLGDSPVGNSPEIEEKEEEVEFRTYKDDSALRDQQSTGRKRAAKMYPMNETDLCEWAMKKNCGGGSYPITGCLNGLQQARHHGPDKNTLNNDKGNVHRICHSCHNRWHTLNDPDYVIVRDSLILHAPLEATVLDIADNEQFWEGRKVVKARD